MNIVVLIKQTFDTEEKITLQDGRISEDGVKFVINPYDEYALEEALRLREAEGGLVTAVTCGPPRSEEALRTALAMGADEAVRLDDAGLSEGAAVAQALAELIRPMAPDVLLAGLFAIDSGAGAVALQVAERLGLPHVSAAVGLKLEADGGGGRTAVVERDAEGDTDTVAVPLPALITAQQGLNEPRYPSLPGIMKAKRKPLRRVDIAELGLPAERLTPLTERTDISLPPPRAAGRRLAGSPAEQAAELVRLLRTEAKLFP